MNAQYSIVEFFYATRSPRVYELLLQLCINHTHTKFYTGVDRLELKNFNTDDNTRRKKVRLVFILFFNYD